ncbi:MAG: cysteine dioxygenase family protein [Acidobacteria bacterium]|nr:cysteine dioxygenase family protein [Acidobacteriota bacterium]
MILCEGETLIGNPGSESSSCLACRRPTVADLDTGTTQVKTEKPLVEIGDFVEGLKTLPRFMATEVYGYVKTHPVEPESLSPYLLFSSASYTRNLIFKNERFELLALCWEIGQVSRIHNHRAQQCWMAAPVGKLSVQNFCVLDRDPEKKTCRLEPGQKYLITPTEPAEVDQNEPVHQVLNLAVFGERAASLHIYSNPIESCEVYSLEQGTYCDVPLYYTSQYGKLCDGETATPLR